MLVGIVGTRIVGSSARRKSTSTYQNIVLVLVLVHEYECASKLRACAKCFIRSSRSRSGLFKGKGLAMPEVVKGP